MQVLGSATYRKDGMISIPEKIAKAMGLIPGDAIGFFKNGNDEIIIGKELNCSVSINQKA